MRGLKELLELLLVEISTRKEPTRGLCALILDMNNLGEIENQEAYELKNFINKELQKVRPSEANYFGEYLFRPWHTSGRIEFLK